MRRLKIKIFTGNDPAKIEKDINEFMDQKGLVTEDFLDLKVSASGVSKKDKDGDTSITMVLLYRKENENGQ